MSLVLISSAQTRTRNDAVSSTAPVDVVTLCRVRTAKLYRVVGRYTAAVKLTTSGCSALGDKTMDANVVSIAPLPPPPTMKATHVVTVPFTALTGTPRRYLLLGGVAVKGSMLTLDLINSL